MTQHHLYPASREDEDLALALALSNSLATADGVCGVDVWCGRVKEGRGVGEGGYVRGRQALPPPGPGRPSHTKPCMPSTP